MPDLVVGAGDVKEARQENLSLPHRSPDVLPQLHQVVGDTPPPSEASFKLRLWQHWAHHTLTATINFSSDHQNVVVLSMLLINSDLSCLNLRRQNYDSPDARLEVFGLDSPRSFLHVSGDRASVSERTRQLNKPYWFNQVQWYEVIVTYIYILEREKGGEREGEREQRQTDKLSNKNKNKVHSLLISLFNVFNR